MTTNTKTLNTKTLFAVKMDKKLKEAAQETAKELGFSLGTIVNALLRQFVREKEVNLSLDYRPNKRLRASIRQSEKEYKEGKLPIAHSVDELMAELNS